MRRPKAHFALSAAVDKQLARDASDRRRWHMRFFQDALRFANDLVTDLVMLRLRPNLDLVEGLWLRFQANQP